MAGKKVHTLQVRISDALAERIEEVLATEQEVRAHFPQLFLDRSFNRATVTRLALDIGLGQLLGESPLGSARPAEHSPVVAWLYPEEGKGSVIPLSPGTHRIGRDPEQVDIIIAHKGVSRLHCAIFVDNAQQILLRDLTGAQRTLVNGQIVDSELPLKAGDVLGISANVIYTLIIRPSKTPGRDELVSPVVRALREFSDATYDGTSRMLELSVATPEGESSAMWQLLDALDELKPLLLRTLPLEDQLRGEQLRSYREALGLLVQAVGLDEQSLDDEDARALAERIRTASGRLAQLLGEGR